MRRDLAALAEQEHDVIVIGGGMFGACAAWDAALRGLSVALLERRDFGGGTSAHSFKMVHGGIRYLQHGDVYRIRESSRERRALLRIAPHLVRPLPIAIPTYGHGLKGKEILALGMAVYDLLVIDRNRGLHDPERRIPRCRVMSRDECLSEFPGLRSDGLTGAALFRDGQMYSPPRLALAFLQSAAEQGSKLANYVEVTEFLREGDKVCGVRARDLLTGDTLTVRGRVVINASGPWAERLLLEGSGLRLEPPGIYSRDACFVVERPWGSRYALAVPGETRDPDALVSRDARHLFLVPWRQHTLVGVWHVVYRGHPDEFTVTEEELEEFIREINQAFPPLALTLQDVSTYNAGLVPFGENKPGARDLSYGKRSRLVDHRKAHGVDGMITVIGVRSTTARGVAEKAVRLACRKLERQAGKSDSTTKPIHGGSIESFRDFRESALAARPERLSEETVLSLVQNHGSAYGSVLACARENPDWWDTLGSSAVLKAEVVHAVREEMAVKLSDVVLRRTDLGSAGDPGGDAVTACAELMAAELGWSRQRLESEVREVRNLFPTFGQSPTAASTP